MLKQLRITSKQWDKLWQSYLKTRPEDEKNRLLKDPKAIEYFKLKVKDYIKAHKAEFLHKIKTL